MGTDGTANESGLDFIIENVGTIADVTDWKVVVTGNSGGVVTQGPLMLVDTTVSVTGGNDRSSGGGPSGGGSSSNGYTISAPSRVSPRNAAKGTTVTITVTTDDGYELDRLTVTDKDVKELPPHRQG